MCHFIPDKVGYLYKLSLQFNFIHLQMSSVVLSFNCSGYEAGMKLLHFNKLNILEMPKMKCVDSSQWTAQQSVSDKTVSVM